MESQNFKKLMVKNIAEMSQGKSILYTVQLVSPECEEVRSLTTTGLPAEASNTETF